MSEWWVYMVRCSDGSIYTGVATDVRARVEKHSAGIGAKYTRGRGPVVLVYTKLMGGQSAACRREAEIKRLPREKKLALAATWIEPC
jgi:putative endonuclease